MNKLCEVTSKSELSELQKSMEKRLKEFEHFEVYKTKLEYLLSHIGKILTGKDVVLSCIYALLIIVYNNA